MEVPRVGHLYERIGVLDRSKHPRRPHTFPVGIAHVIAPDGPVPKKRPSEDGSLHWCFCCDTILDPTSRSALCDDCRRERKRLKQLNARRHEREEFAVTRAQTQAVMTEATRLAESIGYLTIAYNNEEPAALKGRIDVTMLQAKRLLNALLTNLPKVD